MLLCSLLPVDNHVSEQSLQPKEDKCICIYKIYTRRARKKKRQRIEREGERVNSEEMEVKKERMSRNDRQK